MSDGERLWRSTKLNKTVGSEGNEIAPTACGGLAAAASFARVVRESGSDEEA